jgi:hypothetical protein
MMALIRGSFTSAVRCQCVILCCSAAVGVGVIGELHEYYGLCQGFPVGLRLRNHIISNNYINRVMVSSLSLGLNQNQSFPIRILYLQIICCILKTVLASKIADVLKSTDMSRNDEILDVGGNAGSFCINSLDRMSD